MIKFTRIAVILATIIPLTAQAETSQSEPVNYTFTLSPQELAIVGRALGEIPFKDAAPLIRRLDEIIAKQNAERKAAEEKQPSK